MEALGVISGCWSVASLSGAYAGIDAYRPSSKAAAAGSSSFTTSFGGIGLRRRRRIRPRVCRKSSSKKFVGGLEFLQSDHLDYYYSSSSSSSSSSGRAKITTCGSGGGKKEDMKKKKKKKKQEEEEKTTKKKMMKQRLKMLEGLSRDLSKMDFDCADNIALFDQVRAKTISEAAEILHGELKQLIAEDTTELKMMRRRAEKMRLNMQSMPSESTSSSSSESSDSDHECGVQLIDMRKENVIEHQPVAALPGHSHHLLVEENVVTNFHGPTAVIQRSAAAAAAIPREPISSSLTMGAAAAFVEIGGSESPYKSSSCRLPTTGHVLCRDNVDTTSVISAAAAGGGVSQQAKKKIEVCMGGKCKKSGAAGLLGELERRLVGIEGAVSGCKCMGKCRDGPNVRILNGETAAAANPLCIGVGLEDMDLIVSKFIGEISKLGHPATTS